MKKSKKTVHLKHMKRKKFSTLLIKREIFAVAICSFLCLLFLLFFMKDYQAERTAMAANASSNITSRASEYLASSTGELTMFDTNRLQWLCTLNSESGAVISAIYDLTDRKTVADSTRTAFLIVRDKNSEPTASASKIYTCNYDDLDIWREMDSDYAIPRTIPNLQKMTGDSSWIESESDYYYLNEDGTFLPGKGFLYEIVSEYDSPDTILQSFDCTPQDIAAYTKISADDPETTIFGPLIIGYDDSLSNTLYGTFFYPSAKAKEFYDILLAELEETGTTNFNDYIEIRLFSCYRSNYTTFIAANGHEYAVLTVTYFNLFEEFGFILYPLLIAAYAVSLVLGFVSARITYAKLRAQYAMEDYRKTLMNTMAHDLKSPLMTISGYAENLQMNPEHPKRDVYIRGIHSGITYMNKTIEDILTLSKLEDHTVTSAKVPVDLSGQLNTLLEKHRPLIEERNLHIDASGTGSVTGNATLLGEALDNLLVNALTHSPEGSTITISIGNNFFSVSNPCETDLRGHIDELRNPFVTGNESRSDQKGSGLGLAIVQNIANLHSCKLELSFENQTFEARLLFPMRKNN